MIEDKMKTVYILLKVSALIHLLTTLKSGFDIYQFSNIANTSSIQLESAVIGSLVFSLIYPVLFAVAALKSIQGLKEGNPYLWILAVFLGIVSLVSWAAPLGLMVIMILADKRIRDPFITKLDLQY